MNYTTETEAAVQHQQSLVDELVAKVEEGDVLLSLFYSAQLASGWINQAHSSSGYTALQVAVDLPPSASATLILETLLVRGATTAPWEGSTWEMARATELGNEEAARLLRSWESGRATPGDVAAYLTSVTAEEAEVWLRENGYEPETPIDTTNSTSQAHSSGQDAQDPTGSPSPCSVLILSSDEDEDGPGHPSSPSTLRLSPSPPPQRHLSRAPSEASTSHQSFVTAMSPESVTSALFHDFPGSPLAASPPPVTSRAPSVVSHRSPEPQSDAASTLGFIVASLASSTTEDAVRAAFGQVVGDDKLIAGITTAGARRERRMTVLFHDRIGVDNVVEKLDGSLLDGRRIEVRPDASLVRPLASPARRPIPLPRQISSYEDQEDGSTRSLLRWGPASAPVGTTEPLLPLHATRAQIIAWAHQSYVGRIPADAPDQLHLGREWRRRRCAYFPPIATDERACAGRDCRFAHSAAELRSADGSVHDPQAAAEEMEWRREFEEQYLEREREAMEGEGTASQPRGSCRAS